MVAVVSAERSLALTLHFTARPYQASRRPLFPCSRLQNPNVPQKTLECLRDLQQLYNTVSVDDIRYVYEQFNFDDDHIYTCVGTSGRYQQ